MLQDLEQDLSSHGEGLSGAFHTERKSSSWRRIKQRVVRYPPGLSLSWQMLGSVGAAVGFLVGAPVVVAAVGTGAAVAGVLGAGAAGAIVGGAVAGSRTGAGDGETFLERRKCHKIAEVFKAIDEDKNVRQGLQKHQIFLGKCVVHLADFCSYRIDLLKLSSEFRFLLYIMRDKHSPGAAENAQVPTLFDEVLNTDTDTRVSSLMGQLVHSTANQEVSSIIQQILHELREGPDHEEIRTMIRNFIEAKFAQKFKS